MILNNFTSKRRFFTMKIIKNSKIGMMTLGGDVV